MSKVSQWEQKTKQERIPLIPGVGLGGSVKFV